jgi:hypothetical protein
MQFEVPTRPRQVILTGAILALSLLVCGNAFADSCGVLPFSSGRAVNQGAADNITSLISSEVDIRGGFGLVLTATTDELPKGCAKKSSCIVNFGKGEGYERVVSGEVEGLGSSKYRITATLWDVNKGRSIREVVHEMERGASVLVMAIPNLVVELLTGQAPEDEEEGGSDAVSAFEEADFDDEEEEDDTSWMERDRQGRKIGRDESRGNALDGLDDLDDLDLDDMTEDSQHKKSSKLAERKEREAKRRTEEERLEELATIEQGRRNEEARRAKSEARERDDRRRVEREEALQESERAEAKRRDRQQREARRQEDQERAREEERDAERRRAQDREREDQRQEEQRNAYTDYRDGDNYANYELEDEDDEDDEDVIEIESTISLGGGIVMVEDDDGDDYFGPEDDEEQEELQPGDIVEFQGGDYTRRAPASKEDRSTDYRRRDDDRLALNDRGSPGRAYPDDDLDLDSEPDRARASGSDGQDFGNDGGKTGRAGARASATRRGGKSRRDGPFIAIKAGAGWTAYYPETLSLGMFNYGFEASFFALPWLSLDASVNFWSVSLIEYDELGDSVRTVRTLPSFLFGATWHGTFHKVLRPYVGIDLGALLYAQALVENGDSTQIRPLFAPLVAADIGIDFIIIPNFGVYVGGKFGVSYAARVQETVNTSWNPTTGLAEIWAGALVQF